MRVTSGVAKQLNTQDLRKLGNIRKITNLSGDLTYDESPFEKLNFGNSS